MAGQPAVNRSIQVRVLVGEPTQADAKIQAQTARRGRLMVVRFPVAAPIVCIQRRLLQRIGESGRPHLPWKQETGGSNPPALTNSVKRRQACMPS